jgi:hypothetical protein
MAKNDPWEAHKTSVAILARYGHQPNSEIMRMKVSKRDWFTEQIVALVNSEREAKTPIEPGMDGED